MIPDEILWRIALHWPDLGHNWNHVGWNLIAVDDSRSGSCLPDLISPTYVLVMHGLLVVIWPTVRMVSWKLLTEILAMCVPQCCLPALISLCCRSYSRPFVDVAGQWCGVLAHTTKLSLLMSSRIVRMVSLCK